MPKQIQIRKGQKVKRPMPKNYGKILNPPPKEEQKPPKS